MIYSKTKAEDIETRNLMLEAMKIAARNGNKEATKDLGESSAKMAEKIAKHNYSKDETFDQIWQRKVNEGCIREGLPLIYPKQ